MQENKTKCPEPTMMYLLELKAEKDLKFAEKQKEKTRVDLAISLDICPICGCKIIRRDVEYLNPPKTFLFGLIKKRQYIWDFRKVCSNDKQHYEYKYDNDDDYGGFDY